MIRNEIDIILGKCGCYQTPTVQQYDVKSRIFECRLWKKKNVPFDLADDAVVGVVFNWRRCYGSHEYETVIENRNTVVVTVPDEAMQFEGKVEMQLKIHQNGRLLNGPVVTFMALRSLKAADKETDEPALMLVELVDQTQTLLTEMREARENGEFDGEDGFSPEVKLKRIDNGVQIEVIDQSGTKSEIVYDGKDGEDAVDQELIEQIIKDYLAENPTGVDEEQLNQAVEDALAKAKESGEFDGDPGLPGKDGSDGEDGVSPTVSVSAIAGGNRITITDANGTKTVDVLNGEDGAAGKDGSDGRTPVKGVDYFDGKDGSPGRDGTDGYTPVKGVDYFDGKDGQDGAPGSDGKDGTNGKDGVSATHSWNGTTLTVTSASGTSSADLKGDKGDTGDAGADGKDGAAGKDGVSVTHSWSGTTLNITSASGTSSANLKGDKGDKGEPGSNGSAGKDGEDGKDGVSVTHSWSGTTLTVTSASGTSSANLKGEKGDKGDTGDPGSAGSNGKDGSNGTDGVGISSVKQTTTSSADGGSNVVTVTLTNGTTSTFTVKNGSKGSKGDAGKDGSDATVTATSIKNALGYTPADTTTVSQLSDEIDAIGTQEEIVQQVIAALGTPVFGRVEDDKDIILTATNLAAGTYTYYFEGANGERRLIGTDTVAGEPTYTNMLDSWGVTLNQRYSTSTNAGKDCPGMIMFKMPFDAVKDKTVRFKGFGDITSENRKAADGQKGSMLSHTPTGTYQWGTFVNDRLNDGAQNELNRSSDWVYEGNDTYKIAMTSDVINNYSKMTGGGYLMCNLVVSTTGAITEDDIAECIVTIDEPIV